MTKVFDPGDGNFIAIDGHIVEKDALRIAEAINDYDPDLELFCLDPDQLESVTDAPFVVVHRQPDGRYFRVLEAWQLDDRILERIYNADTKRVDSLALIDKMLKEKKRDTERRYQEQRDENREKMLALAVNKKSSFSFPSNKGDVVRIYDDRPATINNNRKSFS